MLSLTTGQAASNPVHVNLRVPVDDVRPQSVTLPNVGPSRIQWGRPADVYTPVCSQSDFWCHHSRADDAIGRFRRMCRVRISPYKTAVVWLRSLQSKCGLESSANQASLELYCKRNIDINVAAASMQSLGCSDWQLRKSLKPVVCLFPHPRVLYLHPKQTS